jgi:hypothetical protein
MSKEATQYFDISKLASKVSKKVFAIESEYDDMVIPEAFRKCSRCKKEKHIDNYGVNVYTGKSRKCCNQCNEYNKQYKLNNK